jgi:hypothetical protein
MGLDQLDSYCRGASWRAMVDSLVRLSDWDDSPLPRRHPPPHHQCLTENPKPATHPDRSPTRPAPKCGEHGPLCIRPPTSRPRPPSTVSRKPLARPPDKPGKLTLKATSPDLQEAVLKLKQQITTPAIWVPRHVVGGGAFWPKCRRPFSHSSKRKPNPYTPPPLQPRASGSEPKERAPPHSGELESTP